MPRRNRVDPFGDRALGRRPRPVHREPWMPGRSPRPPRASPPGRPLDHVCHCVPGPEAPARGASPLDAAVLPRRRRGARGRSSSLRRVSSRLVPVVPRRGRPRPRQPCCGVAPARWTRRWRASASGRGAGIQRRDDRRFWTATVDELPDGTVIVDDADVARLVVGDHTLRVLAHAMDSRRNLDRPRPAPGSSRRRPRSPRCVMDSCRSCIPRDSSPADRGARLHLHLLRRRHRELARRGRPARRRSPTCAS